MHFLFKSFVRNKIIIMLLLLLVAICKLLKFTLMTMLDYLYWVGLKLFLIRIIVQLVINFEWSVWRRIFETIISGNLYEYVIL